MIATTGGEIYLQYEKQKMHDTFQLNVSKTYSKFTLARNYLITPDNFAELWAIIAELAKNFSCSRILVVSDSPPIAKIKSVRAILPTMESAGHTSLKVAYFSSSYTPEKVIEIFKETALAKGATIKFFSEESEALEWLHDNAGE